MHDDVCVAPRSGVKELWASRGLMLLIYLGLVVKATANCEMPDENHTSKLTSSASRSHQG